eukprot:GEMP01002110.1.p1 GENE.GEMP01002110.1~~GEMP01002110.1.p1  ORF type:complete len:1168 (+),score=369.00 GEMP01002110.1:58-3561(+)
MNSIIVSGFGESLKKLNGTYTLGKETSGHPSYIKGSGATTCCVYYWSEDDGMKGWWFAPQINGDEVWARNPQASKLPPRAGWYAPWESKAVNKLISITYRQDGNPPSKMQDVHSMKRPLPVGNERVNPMAKKLKTEEEILEAFTKATEKLAAVESEMTKCEELVDNCKDTGVMFTCEVVDHMSPDEVLEVKKKSDDASKETLENVAKIRKSIDVIRIELHGCHTLGAKFSEVKSKMDGYSKKLAEFSREVNQILADANKGSQKAMAKKRQEELANAAAEKRKKMEEAQKAQRMAVQKVTAFQIIVKPLKLAFKEMTSVKELVDTESVVLAMLEDITKDTPLCNGNALNALRTTASSLKPFVKQLQDKRKDIHLAEAAKVDALGTILAQAIQAYMEKEKLNEEAFFAKIAKSKSEVTGDDIEAFAEGSLELGETYTKALLSSLFGRALVTASTGCEKPKETLTLDDFFMHIARALYSTRSAVMELGDAKKTQKIEDGEIVEVSEGPTGEPLKVKCACNDGVTGMLPFKFLQRMSPQFTVMQETVLTDKHELKDFSVVQRLRPGMKVLATKVPAIDVTTKLLRVSVIVENAEKEKVCGFVTVKGNRGAQLLKQDAAAPADFGAGPVIPKELTMDDWTKMVSAHTDLVTKELRANIEEIEGLKADCEDKCVTLEALADGWTEEVLEKTSNAAVLAWKKIDDLIQSLANKLVAQTRELGNISAEVDGPLSEVKSTVDEVQKQLLDAKSAHAIATKKARELNRKLMNELQIQTKKRELIKDEEFMNGRIAESLLRKELVMGMVNKIDVEPVDEAGIIALQTTIQEGEEMVVNLRTWSDETRKECQTKTVKKSDFGRSLTELSANLAKLNGLLGARKKTLTKLWADAVDKGAALVAKALRDHMEMSQMSEETLFAQLSKQTDGALLLPKLLQFLKELKVDLSDFIVEKIFNKISAKGSNKITANQFVFLITCYYKVVKATTITDALSIKTGKRVCGLKVDDTVEVLGPMETDESTGVSRVRVSFEKQEGYVTVKGNQGSIFLEAQSFYYRVSKDTVITDKFDMQDFRVVRRLKLGDILRARSLPKEEKKSGLWRLEVVVLQAKGATATSGKYSGFVTMKGNQGTSFLEPVTIDDMDLEEPVEGESTVEEKKETKAAETVTAVKDKDGDAVMKA